MKVSDLIADLKIFAPSMRIFVGDPDRRGFTTPGVCELPLLFITDGLAQNPITAASNIEFAAVVGVGAVESVGEFIADLKKLDPDRDVYILDRVTDLYTTPIIISSHTMQIVTSWYALSLNEKTHLASEAEKAVILS